MMRDNIIEKLEGPSSWLNSYVIERKHSRKLQICLESEPLNKALINNYYNQIFSLESIIHRFANKKATKFCKLDVRSGFWHCMLNDKARELTAFGTPQSNYRYKRLPMGITLASKAFQAKMTDWLKDLETTQTKPSITTTRTCEHTCRERNIKINLDKCKFFTEEDTYMGHTLTQA